MHGPCLLTSHAKETALFVETFDQLFNTLTSGNLRSSQKMAHGMSEKSGHKDFLLGMLDWLKTVQPHSAHLPCLSGWMMAIQSLLALWEDLHNNHGVKFLLTDRIQPRLCEKSIVMHTWQRRAWRQSERRAAPCVSTPSHGGFLLCP